MGKFRKCDNCEYSYYEYEDDYYDCELFGYCGIREDKKGNSGCYRSDETINKFLKELEELEK